MLDKIICHEGKNNFPMLHVKKERMEKIANYQIMTITALSFIGEGPRNFLVDKDVPAPTNKATAAVPALPPNKEATEQKEEGKNNNNTSAPKQAGDMNLI